MVVLARVLADGDRPFTAGLLFINNKVALTAPILGYMTGWTGHKVKEYCDGKGWKIERTEHKYEIIPD